MRDTLGYYNPLRYRGYVYDQEVGLYYLQSRYYNAGLGRFNAPDAFTSTADTIFYDNFALRSGISAVSERRETDSQIVLTITIPK